MRCRGEVLGVVGVCGVGRLWECEGMGLRWCVGCGGYGNVWSGGSLGGSGCQNLVNVPTTGMKNNLHNTKKAQSGMTIITFWGFRPPRGRGRKAVSGWMCGGMEGV